MLLSNVAQPIRVESEVIEAEDVAAAEAAGEEVGKTDVVLETVVETPCTVLLGVDSELSVVVKEETPGTCDVWEDIEVEVSDVVLVAAITLGVVELIELVETAIDVESLLGTAVTDAPLAATLAEGVGVGVTFSLDCAVENGEEVGTSEDVNKVVDPGACVASVVAC